MPISRDPFGLAVLLLILWAGAGITRADPVNPGVSVDDVVKAWEARACKVKTLQIKWDERYTEAGKTYDTSFSIALSGDKIRHEANYMTTSLTGQLVRQQESWVWSDDEFRRFLPAGGIPYPIGYICAFDRMGFPPGEGPRLLPLLMLFRPFHPAVATFGNFKKRFRIVAGDHAVEGRRCVLLKYEPEFPSLAFWLFLDPERDFVFTKLEVHGRKDEVPIQLLFHEYEKQNDNWVPVRWTWTRAAPATPSRVTEFSFDAPTDPSEFELRFPPGTWVRVAGSPDSYIVREDGTQRTISRHESFSGKHYEDYLKSESGAFAGGGKPREDEETAKRNALAKIRMSHLVSLQTHHLWNVLVTTVDGVGVRVEPIGEAHIKRPMEVAIPDSICDALLFGKGRDEAAARTKLATVLRGKIEAVDRACGLTDVQKQKLDLAGRGDVARFFERANELRPRLKRVYDEAAVKKGELDPSVTRLCEESRPLRRAVESGPFEDGSLFAKTLKKTLTPDQAAKYESALPKR